MGSVFLFALIGTTIVAIVALLVVGLLNVWIWFMDKMLDCDGAKQFCTLLVLVFISLFGLGSIAYVAQRPLIPAEQKNATYDSRESAER